MLKNKTLRILLILTIILVNIGCDQVSKKMVRENVTPHDEIELIDTKFILTNVENKGAFLSWGTDLPPFWKNVLLLFLPSLMLVFALGYVIMEKDFTTFGLVGLCFVIGGGIGNMIDRILYGSVTDFFIIDLGGIFKTGVFNMADVSIMVGLGLMILHFLFEKKHTASKGEEPSKENA